MNTRDVRGLLVGIIAGCVAMFAGLTLAMLFPVYSWSEFLLKILLPATGIGLVVGGLIVWGVFSFARREQA